MGAGEQFKRSLNILFQQLKSSILVYKDYENDKQNVIEVVGMKNHEKGHRDKVMFQFQDYVDIEVGDVLQQKNARILWKVYELDELVVNDTLVHFDAKVRKLDALGPMPATTPSVTIAISDVSGNVQIAGHNAQQTITSNSTVNNAIGELQKILEEKTLTEEQIEIIADALDVIENAVAKEKTLALLDRVSKKVTQISSIFHSVEGMGARAMGYIKIITDFFSTQPPAV